MLTKGALKNSLADLLKFYKQNPFNSLIKDYIKHLQSITESDEDLGYYIHSNNRYIQLIGTLYATTKIPLGLLGLTLSSMESGLFNEPQVFQMVRILSRREWNSKEKTKILQMVFYIMRYDIEYSDSYLFLLKMLLDCIGNTSTIGEIAVPLTERLIATAIAANKTKKVSKCDLSLGELEKSLRKAEAAAEGRARSTEREIYSSTQGRNSTPVKIGDILTMICHCIVEERNYMPVILLRMFTDNLDLTDDFFHENLFKIAGIIISNGGLVHRNALYGTLLDLPFEFYTKEINMAANLLAEHYDDRAENYLPVIKKTIFFDAKKQKSALTNLLEPIVNIVILNMNDSEGCRKLYFLESIIFKYESKKTIGFIASILDRIRLYSPECDGKRIDAVDSIVSKIVEFCISEHMLDMLKNVMETWFTKRTLDTLIASRDMVHEGWECICDRLNRERLDLTKHLFENLELFGFGDLECISENIAAANMHSFYFATKGICARKEGVPVLVRVLRRTECFEQCSQILIDFYTKICNLYFEKAGIEVLEYDTELVAAPLEALKPKINEHTARAAAELVTSIVRMTNSHTPWDQVFDVFDILNSCKYDGVLILNLIADSYVEYIDDEKMRRLLCAMEDMAGADASVNVAVAHAFYEICDHIVAQKMLSREAGSVLSSNRGGTLWRDMFCLGERLSHHEDMRNSILQFLVFFSIEIHPFLSPDDVHFVEEILIDKLICGRPDKSALDEIDRYTKHCMLVYFQDRYLDSLRTCILSETPLTYLGLRNLQTFVISLNLASDCRCARAVDDSGQACSAGSEMESVASSPRFLFEFSGKNRESSHEKQANLSFAKFLTDLLMEVPIEQEGTILDIFGVVELHQSMIHSLPSYIQAMRRFAYRDSVLIQPALKTLRNSVKSKKMCHLLINSYVSWLSGAEIESVLLVEIGLLLSGTTGFSDFRYIFTNIKPIISESNISSIFDFVLTGCSSINKEEDVFSLHSFLYCLFSEHDFVLRTKKNERRIILILNFYHNMLKKVFSGNVAVLKERAMLDGASNPYGIVLLATKQPSRSLVMKSYSILFSEYPNIKEMVVDTVRKVFREFVGESMCYGDGIADNKIAEVVFCLKQIVLLRDSELFQRVRMEIVDMLVCRNREVLDSIKECFKRYFELQQS